MFPFVPVIASPEPYGEVAKQSHLGYVRWLRAEQRCPCNDGLTTICYDHQHIRRDDRDQPEQAEPFLPQDPAFFVFHPFQEKSSERVDGRLAREAIVNVLIILICFEPQLICIAEEEQAEQQKNNDKSQRGLVGVWHGGSVIEILSLNA